MDKICIDNIKIFAFHGVFDSEKRDGQNFYINITAWLDLKKAGTSDSLKNTVNYAELTELVQDTFVETAYDTIEAAAEVVVEAILNNYPLIKKTCVKVSKPEAPIDADFENVLENYKSTIESILQDKINIERNRLDNFNLKIQSLSPITRLERYKDLVKYNNEQLNKNILYKITFVKNKLNKYIDMLKSRDILDKLSKGLSYNTNVKGKKITTVKNIKVGDEIMSRMKDGSFLSVVKKIYKKS